MPLYLPFYKPNALGYGRLIEFPTRTAQSAHPQYQPKLTWSGHALEILSGIMYDIIEYINGKEQPSQMEIVRRFEALGVPKSPSSQIRYNNSSRTLEELSKPKSQVL